MAGKKLLGKVALITGASRGIGKAIAEKFASEGAKVIINYNKSEKEAKELADRIGGIPIKADVSKSKEVKNMFDIVLRDCGRLDILVNNAGIAHWAQSLEEVNEENWDRIMAVNLKGVFLCSHIAFPIMKKQGGGRIINIASTAGIKGSSAALHYNASKAGVISLTRTYANMLAPIIQVNAIAPGYTDTEMQNHLKGERRKRVIETIPARRFATPEDVAEVALFLATCNDYITGQVIVVDGGRIMPI
ncbi:MAG: 3-oxoacyl-ACP reductase family protein [Candidatus Micrarchaeia archaeon]